MVKDIIFEIKGAVGGDEADIFAGDLFRMYIRYCDKNGWKYKIIDENLVCWWIFFQFPLLLLEMMPIVI